MTSIRPERVAELIQREVTEIFMRKFRDPRLLRVTVTDVEVSGDLKYATIFFSTLEEGDERRSIISALHGAEKAVRRELANRVNLREAPEVRFEFDESIERGARVEEILKQIKEGNTAEDEEA